MKEHYISYLMNERALGLSAGLIALGCILVACYFLFFHPQFKGFAIAMIVLGAIESGVFLGNYARSNKNMEEKIAVYDADPAVAQKAQAARAAGIVNMFFWLKITYALIILAGVVTLSKFNLGTTAAGVVIAIVLHAGLAATIDNFGEMHTKKFLRQLSFEPNTLSAKH